MQRMPDHDEEKQLRRKRERTSLTHHGVKEAVIVEDQRHGGRVIEDGVEARARLFVVR